MRRPEEKNKINVDFFYDSVAKKLGLPREIVKDVYTKYLTRVQQVAKRDNKVMMKGLGTIEIDPKKLLAKLYAFDKTYEKYREAFESDELERDLYYAVQVTSKALKRLKEITKKYDFVERYIQDIRSNNGGVEKLFDNNGNCRKDFREKDIDLQQLSVSVGECEDVPGVLRETREAL